MLGTELSWFAWQVTELERRLTRLSQAAVDQPDLALAALPVLPLCEAELLLERWNATASAYWVTNTAPAMFQQIAVSHPAYCGLVFEGEVVSYGMLEQLASRLACSLLVFGDLAAEVVGLCVAKATTEIVSKHLWGS